MVLGQDRSQTKKIGLGLGLTRRGFALGLGLVYRGLGLRLGLAGLVLCCETRSCYARRHHTDLEGHSNFSGTSCNFSVLCLEHHYC